MSETESMGQDEIKNLGAAPKHSLDEKPKSKYFWSGDGLLSLTDRKAPKGLGQEQTQTLRTRNQ